MRTGLWFAAVAAVLFAGALHGEEWVDYDARVPAMGGAGSVLGRGATGSYYNPANASRRPGESSSFPKLEFDIPGVLQASVHGTSYQNIFEVVTDVTTLSEDFDSGLYDTGSTTLSFDDLSAAFGVFDAMDGLLSLQGDGVYVGMSTGLSVRVSDLFGARDGFAFHFSGFGLAAASPVVDLDSLRQYRLVDESGADWEAMLDTVITTSGAQTPSTPGGQAYSTQLQAAGYQAQHADLLAAVAEDSGISFGGAGASVLFDFMVNTLNGTGDSLESGANPLEGNKTGFLLRGMAYYEFGVSASAGIPIEGLKDWLAFGATFKVIQAFTFSRLVVVDDLTNDGFDTVVDDITDQLREAYTFGSDESSANFGLDIGIIFTPQLPILDGLTLSLVGRNINGPEFAWSSPLAGESEAVRFDPQFRAGASYTLLGPTFPLTLAFEMDLNSVSSDLLPNYNTQFLRAGVAFEPDFGFLGFGLRAGVLKNIADAEQALTVTAGIGLRLWVVSFDVAGQLALESQKIGEEGKETSLPQRIGISMRLAVGFDF